MRALTRRLAVALAIVAVLPASAYPASRSHPIPTAAPSLTQPFTAPAYVMGSPRAKVTITEYASVACPHCARFDALVFPALKAKYVDTGKVRFELREMLVGSADMVQVAAAGFLLARCTGKDHYFGVVEAVYRAQPEIFASNDPKSVFVRIAKANGLDEKQLDACIGDKASIDALNARYGQAFRIFKGTECDILPDGSLDFPDDLLAGFDYVVTSVIPDSGWTAMR